MSENNQNPDTLLNAARFAPGILLFLAIASILISVDPLGIIHAPICPTEAC